VYSENYATLARLSAEKFKEILQKYPKLEVMMKAFMKTYNDPFRKFIFDSMQKVPYFD
jgi:hypothetical protein